jgi:hypothetical protein
MGKRSSFERRPGDFYATPLPAVLPLVPYLRGILTFAEPCCGDGALVRHLEAFGLACTYSGDIRDGQDALAIDSYGAIDAIITNPPWSRDLMHRLIEHFARIAPTWLLLESDWANTKQAAPFMPSCSDIVAIGRVKWIEGSKHTGKDNHAWFRFDARHDSGPAFHWRDGTGRNQEDLSKFGEVSRRSRVCAQCRKPYQLQRSTSRFCSPTCRQRAHRRLSVTSVTPAPSEEVFRYVRHDDVARFTAEGWQPLRALDGTHHGEYSVLMRRREA